MSQRPSSPKSSAASRREFLSRLGQAAAAVGVAAVLPGQSSGQAAQAPAAGQVGLRTLGKTGLKVSEIGIGGHSWNFKRVPDGSGGLRRVNLDEAARMIAIALERGVNFFDSCSPLEEHSVPGEVIKKRNARDRIIVSARLCHKMKGARSDQETIEKWVDQRLKLWQTDYFDILMLTNNEGDTPQTGFWDMTYSLETIEKLKKQGKIRFAGFGCHFTPDWFRKAFSQFGQAWDVCSLPYSARNRMAEDLLPEAEKLNLGVVTIKSLRGSVSDERLQQGPDAGLTRDLIAFVLENQQVHCCICGMHSEAHVEENLSAAWTKLTPEARQRLQKLAAHSPGRTLAWLEDGWVRPTA